LQDAEVQPTFEVYERVLAPDVLAQLLAQHDLAWFREQKCQHSGGLRRQLDELALTAEFACPVVEFKQPKPSSHPA
jgi:hypothetical protein